LEYALLYNPVAGRGRALALAEEVQRILTERGERVVEGRSERPGHIAELARELAGSVDRVLVMGGDGSLREAAEGLIGLDGRGEAAAALGVLPMGSGNVVARELGLPLDPLDALEVQATGGERRIDVGAAEAGGARHLFLAMMGVGFDAEVAGHVARARSTPLGSRIYRRSGDLVYGAVGLRAMLFGGRARFALELDGEEAEPRCAAAVVCNARVYGKGMVLTPDAVPDDGELDVHVRRSSAPWVTATALARAQARRPIPTWAARVERAREVRVTARGRRGVPWQLDGDAMPPAPEVRARIVPGALRVLAGSGTR